jgi:hypothetical protein
LHNVSWERPHLLTDIATDIESNEMRRGHVVPVNIIFVIAVHSTFDFSLTLDE